MLTAEGGKIPPFQFLKPQLLCAAVDWSTTVSENSHLPLTTVLCRNNVLWSTFHRLGSMCQRKRPARLFSGGKAASVWWQQCGLADTESCQLCPPVDPPLVLPVFIRLLFVFFKFNHALLCAMVLLWIFLKLLYVWVVLTALSGQRGMHASGMILDPIGQRVSTRANSTL